MHVLCFCLTSVSNSFCSFAGRGGGPGRLKPPEERCAVVDSIFACLAHGERSEDDAVRSDEALAADLVEASMVV